MEKAADITARKQIDESLRRSLEQTARGQRLLTALSQAAQSVQRAHTPEEIYRTVGDEVARLGYHAAVFILTEDETHLAIPYLNFDSALQRTAERLVGITAADFRLPLTPGGFYQRTLAGGETVFLDPFLEPVTEAVPGLLRPLVGQLTALLGIKQGIIAPLRIRGEVRSLLMVTGGGLTADDVLAVNIFASQTAIALENARLYQETRAWAAELEQRVQTQTETIRAAEERLRTVVTNAPIVLWATDREGNFTLSEGKGLEPLGLKPGELVGQSVFEVYRNVPPIPADNRRALAGESFTSTVEVSGLIFDTHYAPMRDAHDQVIGVTGVSIDITERKRAEEALHASQRLIEGIINAIPVRVFWKDKNLVYLGCNTIFARDAGFADPQDIIGKADYQMGWSDQAELYRDDDRQVIESGRAKSLIEEPQTTPEGHTITLLTSKMPLRSPTGEIIGVLGTYMDITERKRVEEALHESEDRFRDLVENSQDLICIHDLEGKLLSVNPASAKLSGYSEAELLGMNLRDFLVPEARRRFAAYLAEIQAKGSASGLMLIQTKSGEKRIWEYHNTLRTAGVAEPIVRGTAQDITERKRAEKALNESEERFRSLFVASPDALMLIDPSDHTIDWPIVDCNEIACQMNGYTREELIGKSIDILNISEGTPQERAAYLERVRREGVLHLEAFHRHRDGHVFPVEISTSIVTFAGRELILGIDRDITERQRMEEALRESEERFKSIVESLPLGIHMYELTPQGALIFTGANPAADALFGVSNATFIGKTIETAFPPLAETEVPARYREVAITGTPWQTEQISYEDDRIRDAFAVVAFRIAENKMVAIFADITVHKQAEAAMTESEERFRVIFERSTIGKSLTAPDGRLIKINQAFTDMLGYTIEEMQQVNFAQIMHPDDVTESRECIRILLANERPAYRMEKRYLHKSGAIVWADVSTQLLRDSNGAPRYFMTSIQDISDRKRAEQALAQKTQELERSNAELEHFAYVASHDLQEPLRMVSSFMGLLAQRYQGQLDADADEFIGFAIDGAQRMQRLINGLLDYSRVGTRSQPPEPTDASAVADDALWNLELAIQDAGATVTRDPLPTVMADHDQLMQLFQNLIANGIKFRGAEPPRVHISARQTFEVSETSKVSSKIWEFSVRDNGIGIAAENLDRVFGIFQRLHARTEYPGTGIGLATCKKIVERYGGRIWVESQPGQGSTFFFTIPAAT